MFKKLKGKKKTQGSEPAASAAPPASHAPITTAPGSSLPAEGDPSTSADIRPAMEQELTRVRDELSRAVITCDRRETESARAQTDLMLCREDLARANAFKMEKEEENRRLQGDIASLEREMSRMTSQVDHLKEELDRAKAKVGEKKQLVSELKAECRRLEEEREGVERGGREREQTWQTIRRDLTARRDDAIKEACRVRRQNEKLKTRINKLKTEKSSILLRAWEKKQTEKVTTKRSRGQTESEFIGTTKETKHAEDGGLHAKVLSLELQLYRQARLVELLLDVIQENDPQFTAEQRIELTSAFANPGSKPEDLAQKLRFV